MQNDNIERSILFQYSQRELQEIKAKNNEEYKKIIFYIKHLLIIEINSLITLNEKNDYDKYIKIYNLLLKNFSEDEYQDITKNLTYDPKKDLDALKTQNLSEEEEIILLIDINLEKNKIIKNNEGYSRNAIQHLIRLKEINKEKFLEYLSNTKKLNEIKKLIKTIKSELQTTNEKPDTKESIALPEDLEDRIKLMMNEQDDTNLHDLFDNHKMNEQDDTNLHDLFDNHKFNEKNLYQIKQKDPTHYDKLILEREKLIIDKLEKLKTDADSYTNIKHNLIFFAKNDSYNFLKFISNNVNYKNYTEKATQEIEEILNRQNTKNEETVNIINNEETVNIINILITLPQEEQEQYLNRIKQNKEIFDSIKTKMQQDIAGDLSNNNNNEGLAYFAIINFLSIDNNEDFSVINNLDPSTNRAMHLINIASFANSPEGLKQGLKIFKKRFYLEAQIIYTLKKLEIYGNPSSEIINLLCDQIQIQDNIEEAIHILTETDGPKNIEFLKKLLSKYNNIPKLKNDSKIKKLLDENYDKDPNLTTIFHRPIQKAERLKKRARFYFVIKSAAISILVITIITLLITFPPAGLAILAITFIISLIYLTTQYNKEKPYTAQEFIEGITDNNTKEPPISFASILGTKFNEGENLEGATTSVNPLTPEFPTKEIPEDFDTGNTEQIAADANKAPEGQEDAIRSVNTDVQKSTTGQFSYALGDIMNFMINSADNFFTTIGPIIDYNDEEITEGLDNENTEQIPADDKKAPEGEKDHEDKEDDLQSVNTEVQKSVFNFNIWSGLVNFFTSNYENEEITEEFETKDAIPTPSATLGEEFNEGEKNKELKYPEDPAESHEKTDEHSHEDKP